MFTATTPGSVSSSSKVLLSSSVCADSFLFLVVVVFEGRFFALTSVKNAPLLLVITDLSEIISPSRSSTVTTPVDFVLAVPTTSAGGSYVNELVVIFISFPSEIVSLY